jgi:preprotein translocase subunit SecB
MKLSIAQIILEDASFSHHSEYLTKPAGTTAQTSPVEIGLELVKGLAENVYLMRLRVKSVPDAVYTFAITYVALMKLDAEGEPVDEEMDRRLMITGAHMLFPYAREMVSNFTNRGRFGPTWLGPTDFSKIEQAGPPVAATTTL